MDRTIQQNSRGPSASYWCSSKRSVMWRGSSWRRPRARATSAHQNPHPPCWRCTPTPHSSMHAAYAPAKGCDNVLNAWCEGNCPHAPLHSPLFARLDTNQNGGPVTWRCYAKSTLSDDLMQYKQGETYCTRPQHLGGVLVECLKRKALGPGNPAPPASPLQQPAQQQTQAQYARSAANPRKPPPLPPPSFPGCEDLVSECAVWASYDECRQATDYMLAKCPASCGQCRQGGPPKPSPRTPPPSPPPPTTEPKGQQQKEDEEARRAHTYCASPCDKAAGAQRCSGRGTCAEWKGHAFCVCAVRQLSGSNPGRARQRTPPATRHACGPRVVTAHPRHQARGPAVRARDPQGRAVRRRVRRARPLRPRLLRMCARSLLAYHRGQCGAVPGVTRAAAHCSGRRAGLARS